MTSNRTILAAGITIVVLAAIIGAFFSVGSPASERLRREDNQRSSDLQSIEYGLIDSYTARTQALPTSLEAAKRELVASSVSLTDPSGISYEYAVVNPTTYRLCATFALPSSDNADTTYPKQTDSFWTHSAGRTCFTFKMQSVSPNVKTSIPVPAVD